MTFKKGISGNPKGRPVGTLSLVDILREKLGKISPGCDNTVADEVVDSYIAEAFKKSELKKDMFDRIDGKPKQSPEDPGSKDNPLHVQHSVIWG